MSHEPLERVTVTLACARSATVPGLDDLGQDADVPCPALADVEAWCAALRRRGAPGDLVLGEASGLSVTLDVDLDVTGA